MRCPRNTTIPALTRWFHGGDRTIIHSVVADLEFHPIRLIIQLGGVDQDVSAKEWFVECVFDPAGLLAVKILFVVRFRKERCVGP